MDAEKTGRFIASLRKQKGLTQLELASLLRVSDKAVSRWETGRGFPDLDSLESLSEQLGVSVTELLKGEQLGETVPGEDMRKIESEGLVFIKRLLTRRRYLNLLAGFLAGLVVLTLLVVHLNSPVYVKNAESALAVETLPDGRVVAVLGEDVAGYDLTRVQFPDSGRTGVFLSCYRTGWSLLTGKKGETVVVLGKEDSLDEIYYYPADGGDELLYGTAEEGSPTSLPRLLYNVWIFIGFVLTAAGTAAWLFLRKKRCGPAVLKAALLPFSFTVSALLCLAGRFHEVYNASFFFTGIVLTTALLYVLLLLLSTRLQGWKK